MTGTNDLPTPVVDTGAVAENASVTVNVLANDTDLDDGATFTLDSVSAPADKGTVSIVSNELVFVANAHDFDHLALNATENVVVTYTMSDESGTAQTSTATITVTGTNDLPTPLVDTGAVAENASVTVNVLDNDTDSVSYTHLRAHET